MYIAHNKNRSFDEEANEKRMKTVPSQARAPLPDEEDDDTMEIVQSRYCFLVGANFYVIYQILPWKYFLFLPDPTHVMGTLCKSKKSKIF